MKNHEPKGTRARSVGAVFSGLLANVIPAVALDGVLHATNVFPPVGEPMADELFALATSYRVAAALAGGYITARLAPSRPMKHVFILGSIGVAASTAGAVAMWDAGPAWYPLGLVAMALPVSLAGAKLAETKHARAAA